MPKRRRGRPPNATPSYELSTMVRAADFERVQRLAQREGLTRAAWLRRLVIQKLAELAEVAAA